MISRAAILKYHTVVLTAQAEMSNSNKKRRKKNKNNYFLFHYLFKKKNKFWISLHNTHNACEGQEKKKPVTQHGP